MNAGVYAETGLFVCFEGGEGAGKSTQSRLLRAWLVERGEAVLLTFEPGDTSVGKELRRIVLDPATGDLSDRTESLLYAADKAEHVDTVVLPALARGEVTEDRAFAVAREVAHLDPEQRSKVDDDVAPRLAGLGDARLRQAVRRSCLTIAAEAEARRHSRARRERGAGRAMLALTAAPWDRATRRRGRRRGSPAGR